MLSLIYPVSIVSGCVCQWNKYISSIIYDHLALHNSLDSAASFNMFPVLRQCTCPLESALVFIWTWITFTRNFSKIIELLASFFIVKILYKYNFLKRNSGHQTRMALVSSPGCPKSRFLRRFKSDLTRPSERGRCDLRRPKNRLQDSWRSRSRSTELSGRLSFWQVNFAKAARSVSKCSIHI